MRLQDLRGNELSILHFQDPVSDGSSLLTVSDEENRLPLFVV